MPDRSLALIACGAAVLLVSLGGCDSLRRGLGMEKVIPDEFQVVSRAPLAIPPDFALRPPKAGAPRPQDVATSEQAKQSVFRAADAQGSLTANADRSAGEGVLLRQAGAASVEPSIRQVVNQENAGSLEVGSGGFVDKLLFWKDQDKMAPTNKILNPQDEAQRLRNQADGDAPLPEDIPTISRKSSVASSAP